MVARASLVTRLPWEKHMNVSKRVILAGLAGTVTGVSTVALAQMSQKKSQHLGKLDEDEVMRVNPRTGAIQKSNRKISEDLHSAAMRAGAKEIPPTTVVYKHAGKMYMFDYQDAANTQTAINFQSQFDDE
jgi:hypothetical protein